MRTSRRPLLLAAALSAALAAVPAVAAAHVELESSTPAAGETLESAPGEVVLTFSGELDPAGSSFTVLDHHDEEVGSGEVDLDVADRNVMRGDVSIEEPGVYTVEWTALGADGHEITGSFSFGYETDEEIPAGEGGHDHEGESPDTAMPAPALPLATLLGVLLLAFAVLIARRSLVR